MFAPRVIFLGLWSIQIFAHLIFASDFHAFVPEAWWVVSLGVGSFVLGTLLISRYSSNQENFTDTLSKSYIKDIQSFSKLFILIYPLWVLYALLEIYFLILKMDIPFENLQDFRSIVIDDFNDARLLTRWLRVLYLGVSFSIFFIAHLGFLTRRQLLIIALIGLFAALLTSGRLYLLLYFLAVIALLYRSKIISIKGVLLGGFLFAILFSFIALLLHKGNANGANSLLATVGWNIKVYFLSSLSCFNEYLAIGAPPIPGGTLIPNALRAVFLDFGFSMPMRPRLNPFLYVPVPCNTYTFLFPLFHDGNLYGVMIGSFLIGCVQQFLFLKFKLSNIPVWRYLYAISLYGIFMTIFEDPYFSSPGFWLQLLSPVIAFYLYQRRHYLLQYFKLAYKK